MSETYVKIMSALIALMLLFSSCKKKYEEDPGRSLRCPEKRLVGDWKIKEYTYNNNSIIDLLNTKIKTFDIRELIYRVYKPSRKTNQSADFIPKSFLQQHYQESQLGDNESALRFSYYVGDFSGVYNHEDTCFFNLFITPLSIRSNYYFTKWDIKNLFKNKLHLQLKTDSGNYDIFFEK